jgi:pimeloyl-ACP methyl ester carboxylesterase
MTKRAKTGSFRASDGTEIYFEDTGGDAPAMFYIYGLACSIRHWKYPLAHFGPGGAAHRPHRQVWLDFRGHGKSKRQMGGGPLRVARIVQDVVELCRHREIAAATFLGQSMGGSIALELAHRHPQLVKGLVLLTAPGRDPGASLPFQPIARRAWRGLIELNRRAPLVIHLGYLAAQPYQRITKPIVREVVRNMGFNPKLSRTDDIDEYVGKVFEVNPNAFYDMAGELMGFDVAALDPPVRAPALVIAGEKDQVVPIAEARRLAEHLPGGELAVVPHGSHCPHFDDPGLVNRLIEDFLDRHRL